jgi:hypothetical protein
MERYEVLPHPVTRRADEQEHDHQNRRVTSFVLAWRVLGRKLARRPG